MVIYLLGNTIKIMKKKLLILISLVILSSCQKRGCTDYDAVNYNESAKKDYKYFA